MSNQNVSVEVIYSDDCSTDDSVEIAWRFEADGVVVLASPCHRGVCETRNRGAAVAKGQYLVFLDGDDLLSRDFVARNLDAMEAGGRLLMGLLRHSGRGSMPGRCGECRAGTIMTCGGVIPSILRPCMLGGRLRGRGGGEIV